jgi:Ca-activated chloride channel family protein
MMKKFSLHIILGFFLLFPLTNLKAQYVKEKRITRILFIFDASNSMNGQWQSGKKIDIARNILIKLVDSLEQTESIQMALRVYGHQYSFVPHQVCTDSKLEVPFAKDNAKKIREKLQSIVPKGTTPIAYSLLMAGNDFPPCKNCKNVIVLITDGIEECDGDPCKIALMLQSKGITLKPYVIGIGLNVELRKAFECVGKYYEAYEENSFEDGLKDVVKNALNQTTAQVNLLDINKKPLETNVNMTFYDQNTNELLFNSIHTLNQQGNPDTIFLEPATTYKIVVNTIPPVELENIKIKPKVHNVISIPAAQGYLQVETNKGNSYKGERYIVRQAGKSTTIYAPIFGQKEKYLIGKYDIEVLSLPRLYYTVSIEQSKTNLLIIPEPGIANFIMPSVGYGSLYVLRNNIQEWVCNLNNTTKTAISLQPGKYRAIYRTELATKMDMTVIEDFTVESERSVVIKF